MNRTFNVIAVAERQWLGRVDALSGAALVALTAACRVAVGGLVFCRFTMRASSHAESLQHNSNLDTPASGKNLILLQLCVNLDFRSLTSLLFGAAQWGWFSLVVAAVSILLLVIARLRLEWVVTSDTKGEMPMTNKATNDATGTARRTNRRSVTRPLLETMLLLWLSVEANFITGLEAA